jgi:hypothetical protein
MQASDEGRQELPRRNRLSETHVRVLNLWPFGNARRSHRSTQDRRGRLACKRTEATEVGVPLAPKNVDPGHMTTFALTTHSVCLTSDIGCEVLVVGRTVFLSTTALRRTACAHASFTFRNGTPRRVLSRSSIQVPMEIESLHQNQFGPRPRVPVCLRTNTHLSKPYARPAAAFALHAHHSSRDD